MFEQVGANWSGGETTGRFVQMMRFRDRKHQLSVQTAERQDPGAQQLIAEFCELINFPYQQQQGLFAVGFYQSVLPVEMAIEPVEMAVESIDGRDQFICEGEIGAARSSLIDDHRGDIVASKETGCRNVEWPHH